MNKAILIMDMPKCCNECFALDDNGDYPMCLITQEQRGYNFRTREQKMDKCPFKKLPNELSKLPFEDDYDWGYRMGWNNCIGEMIEE